ncbi:antitoxin Xre/MbcA/ParS toxin-binding domain-containing protein [Flavobacterium sp.]|uniref:antitoxin Xre/MbcA/ParS toxin-binding domain-containing protein n=1 Tax=Flavobacterium sp. TaxID=239 RepID=UPI003750040D
MKTKNKPYQEREETMNIVSEPMAIYLPSSFVKNNVLENLAQNSKELFSKVIAMTGLTIKTLSENIFEITPKTFIKYKNNDTKIPSRIAEIAIEISALYELGNIVFNNSTIFNEWLEKENVFFNNKKPSVFLNTSTGIHLIYEELKRIEFGATA